MCTDKCILAAGNELTHELGMCLALFTQGYFGARQVQRINIIVQLDARCSCNRWLRGGQSELRIIPPFTPRLCASSCRFSGQRHREADDFILGSADLAPDDDLVDGAVCFHPRQ